MGKDKNFNKKKYTMNTQKIGFISKRKTETFPLELFGNVMEMPVTQIKKYNQHFVSSVSERDINIFTSPNTVTKYYLVTK